MRRFILFHGKRHPSEMGKAEVVAFLNHLTGPRQVSASIQSQALNALLFLYKRVLETPLAAAKLTVQPRCSILSPKARKRVETTQDTGKVS